jgi:hypothetical protein
MGERSNPERVVSILKLVEIRDVTPGLDFVNDDEEQQTLDKERNRRTNFTFSSVNIPIGSVLHFVRDEDITVSVVDDKSVDFEGEITSLSQSSIKILVRDFGWKSTQVTGPRYWVYENETLSERRLRLENEN